MYMQYVYSDYMQYCSTWIFRYMYGAIIKLKIQGCVVPKGKMLYLLDTFTVIVT